MTVNVGSSVPDLYTYFSGVVQTDSALLVGLTEYDYRAPTAKSKTTYKAIDVRTPGAPKLAAGFEVPENMANQGWGRYFGFCGLDMGWGWGGYYGYGYYGYNSNTVLVSGDIIASSHAEALDEDASRGRYYLDRIDVSDPENPVFLELVNVPGRVARFEADNGRLLTIQRNVEAVALDQNACWERSQSEPSVTWVYTNDYTEGHCENGRQILHLLKLDADGAELVQSVALDDDGWFLGETAITSERVFVKQYQTEPYTDSSGYTYWTMAKERLSVFDESLDVLTTLDLSAQARWGWDPLRARGTRAFTADSGTLNVFDASDTDDVKVYSKELRGYGCNELEVRGDVALCSQGKKGIEAIPLD